MAECVCNDTDKINMCGIAGYTTIGTNKTTDPTLINKMIDVLIHRGPDDKGTVAFPQVVLGNCRLSIIDIADGKQPICNEDKTIYLVYNGELYNSPELRQDLIGQGHCFRTHTDTEVLVHLFEQEGIDFLKMLNGMFAFALYDARNHELLIARDRFGVKPLFYSYQNGMLSFASEIKALKSLPYFDTEIDPQALAIYLGFFFIPDPWTIYRNVRRLHPGHYIRLSKNGLVEGKYYDLDYSKKVKIDKIEAAREVVRLFRQSVKRQLLSDVPIGVLLSGGLDSRSVLAVASEYTTGMKSFTITFKEKAFNEGEAARYWSRVFGSCHHQLCFRSSCFCKRLLNRQRHLDEPFAIWCNVAMAELAHFIQKIGLKVVLSGDGGDELFCGYPTLQAAYFARLYRFFPHLFRKKIVQPMISRLPAGVGRLPLSFMLKSFVEADDPHPFRNFMGFKEVIRYRRWPEMLTPEAFGLVKMYDPFEVYRQYLPLIEDLHLIDALSYLDIKVFLSGNVLMSNDNAFMEASVEQRVPFLDNDLVDFLCRLPVNIRFHPIKLKTLLRHAMSKHLPSVQSRTRKRPHYSKKGFEVPGNLWLKEGCFAELSKKILSSKRILQTGFFNPRAVESIIGEQMAGRQNNERIIQTMMSLILFIDGTYEV